MRNRADRVTLRDAVITAIGREERQGGAAHSVWLAEQTSSGATASEVSNLLRSLEHDGLVRPAHLAAVTSELTDLGIVRRVQLTASRLMKVLRPGLRVTEAVIIVVSSGVATRVVERLLGMK